jgi:hypothetical protein
MAFTTLSALVTAVTGMTITGVNAKFAYRPRRINAAQLPILYTRLPSRKREISTLTYGQGLKQATIEIVIVVEMLNLNTQPANDALAVTLTDALGDALESNAATLGMDSYEIASGEDTLDDGTTPVQVIVATVEVSG